jgi:hypothetical protein
MILNLLFPEDMPAKKKEVDPCYPEFVRVWCEEYPELRFNATSGKKIKELILDTKWRMRLRGKHVEAEDVSKVTAAFKYVIAYVKRSNHFVNRKPITTFQGQYLSIITEIESGKTGLITKNKPSTRDIINSL